MNGFSGGNSPPSFSQRFSRLFVRIFSSPAFVVSLTILILAWISVNTFLPSKFHFDVDSSGHKLIALNFILSMIALYSLTMVLQWQRISRLRDDVTRHQLRQIELRDDAVTEFNVAELGDISQILASAVSRDDLAQELRIIRTELAQQRQSWTPPTD